MNPLRQLVCYSEGTVQDKDFVAYTLYTMGRDYLLVVSGGETHIGALGCSENVRGAAPHFFTLVGHREDAIVKQAVTRLSGIIKGELLVVCGIHYDQITREQIAAINSHSDMLLKRIENYLKKYLSH